MKEIIGFIKKYLGELMVIFGTGIFSYNVFNFSYTGGFGGERIGGGRLRIPTEFYTGRYEFEYVAYYYTNETLLYVALGTMLIIRGVFVIRNKRKRNSE